MFIVYTKIHNEDGIEYWYYGQYNDEDRANEVALELGGSWPVYHCVCSDDDWEMEVIQNLPLNLKK